MIDQATIAVIPGIIQIRPDLIVDEALSLHPNFEPMGCNRSNDAKKHDNAMHPVYQSWFDVFAGGALRVYTRSKDVRDSKRSEQFVYLISLNLRKILWGHNGRNLEDGDDITHGLLIVRHALSHLLVRSDQASWLIPGVGDRGVSYWQFLELAMDVRDPGQVIRRRLEGMRSPSVRRDPRFYEHTTLLDGKDVDIKVYDKLNQMRDRHKAPKKTIEVIEDDPITRLEVSLKDDKLTNFSYLEPGAAPATTEIRERMRLTGFRWHQLKAIHYHYFSSLKAVYYHPAKPGAKPEQSYAAVLAAIAGEYDINPQAIYDLLVSYSGRKQDTCRSIRRAMEEHLAKASELKADVLLSEHNYRNQPEVRVKGLGGCRFYVRTFGWNKLYEVKDDVTKVYGGAKQKPLHALPSDHYLRW